MTQIRVAIIGGGGIGGAHLKAYGAWTSLCQIVGIADVQLETAQAKAAQVDCAAFADYGQMLDEVQPDAISICTPPNMHLPVAQAAAARGIHVLCEKPPARTLAETQALVDAMAQSGALPFAIAFTSPLCRRKICSNRDDWASSCRSKIALAFALPAPVTLGLLNAKLPAAVF